MVGNSESYSSEIIKRIVEWSEILNHTNEAVERVESLAHVARTGAMAPKKGVGILIKFTFPDGTTTVRPTRATSRAPTYF